MLEAMGVIYEVGGIYHINPELTCNGAELEDGWREVERALRSS